MKGGICRCGDITSLDHAILQNSQSRLSGSMSVFSKLNERAVSVRFEVTSMQDFRPKLPSVHLAKNYIHLELNFYERSTIGFYVCVLVYLVLSRSFFSCLFLFISQFTALSKCL